MADEFVITPDFTKAVYDVVETIPEGTVATYGQVAEMANFPGKAREVGVVMSRVQNEQHLPCHRIVNKTGMMSPEYAFGGQEKQRKMLEKEGIRFKSNGTVDMERFQFGNIRPQQELF